MQILESHKFQILRVGETSFARGKTYHRVLETVPINRKSDAGHEHRSDESMFGTLHVAVPLVGKAEYLSV